MATSCTQIDSDVGLLGRVPGPLVLRIRRGEHAGQILNLKSAKCSIGSHEHATLRLVAAGLRPVHCLILRGEQGTYVRQWSPDTLLNGSAFDTQPLRSGDRLAIGHIELDVVDVPVTSAGHDSDLNGSADGETDPPAPTCPPDPRVDEQRRLIERLSDELAQMRGQLDEAESRRLELSAAINEANQRAGDWELQFAEQDAKVRKRVQQADEARDDLRKWQDNTERLYNELEKTRQEHQRVREEWHTERETLKQELAERTETLKKQRLQHDELMDEAESLIHSLQHEGKQLLAQLAEAKQAIRLNTEQREQLEAAIRRHEAVGAAQSQKEIRSNDEVGMQIPSAQVCHTVPMPMCPVSSTNDAPVSAGPSATMPLDEAAIKSLAQQAAERTEAGDGPLNQETSEEEIVAQQTALSETLSSASDVDAESQQAGVCDPEDDVEYIHDYVRKLLGRVDSPESTARQPQAQSPNDVKSPVSLAVSDAGNTAGKEGNNLANAGAIKSDADAKRLTKSAVAPEVSDIGAMREVANSTTRSAIDISQRRRQISYAVGRLSLGAVGTVCGITALVMSSSAISVFSVSGVFCLTFSAVCVWRAVKAIR